MTPHLADFVNGVTRVLSDVEGIGGRPRAFDGRQQELARFGDIGAVGFGESLSFGVAATIRLSIIGMRDNPEIHPSVSHGTVVPRRLLDELGKVLKDPEFVQGWLEPMSATGFGVYGMWFGDIANMQIPEGYDDWHKKLGILNDDRLCVATKRDDGRVTYQPTELASDALRRALIESDVKGIGCPAGRPLDGRKLGVVDPTAEPTGIGLGAGFTSEACAATRELHSPAVERAMTIFR